MNKEQSEYQKQYMKRKEQCRELHKAIKDEVSRLKGIEYIVELINSNQYAYRSLWDGTENEFS